MATVPALVTIYLICVTRASDTGNVIPGFTAEPQSSFVEPGSSISLTCSVQPAGSIVRWTFNGSVVTSSQRRRLSIESRDGTSILRVTSFNTSQHDGAYQCQALTTAGSVVSREARLEAVGIGSFPTERRGVESVTITHGNVAVIPCPVPPPSRPPAVIEYHLNGVALPMSPRSRILQSGNLHLSNVTAADDGVYQCVAVNPVTSQRVTSPVSYRLSVTDRPASDIVPVFNVHTKTNEQVTALQGTNITLECAAEGWPVPQLSWEKYGGHLPVGRYSLVLGNLVIHSAEKFDAGTYLCRANNSAGLPQTKIVSVDILEPPVVEAVQSSINSTEGSTVVLRCRVHGSAKLATRWMHNASPVSTAAQLVTVRETSLMLSHVQLNQQGIYQCLVRNDVGTAHAAVRLIVSPSTDVDYETDDDDGVIDVSLPDSDRTRLQGAGPATDRIRHSGGRAADGSSRNDEKAGIVASPSRPEVSKVSDTSLLVQWTVPLPSGPHITSFRLQYKELVEERSAIWQTVDEDIPPAWRSYEIARLRIGRSYRFRVIAIYSTGESSPSLLSAKILITSATTTPPFVKTAPCPVIVEVRPLSVSEMFIGWQMEGAVRPVDGFFIYYAPFDKDDSIYEKHIVHGSSVRHAVLSHLKAGTPYSIRMTSFNAASAEYDGGESDFSNSVVRSTLAYGDERVAPGGQSRDDANSGPAAGRTHQRSSNTARSFSHRSTVDSNTQLSLGAQSTTYSWVGEEYVETAVMVENQLLYVVLGTVLGVVVLITIVCTAMCMWKQQQPQRIIAAAKQQKQMQQAAMSVAPSSVLQTSSLLKPKPASSATSAAGRFDQTHVPGCGGGCSGTMNGCDLGHMRDSGGIYANGQMTLGRRKVVPSPQPLAQTTSCSASMGQVYNEVYNGSHHSSVAENNVGAPGSVYSPIYSKLTDTDDSPSPSFDRRPARMQATQRQSLDHIPRLHELHHPYWAVEPVRQTLNSKTGTANSAVLPRRTHPVDAGSQQRNLATSRMSSSQGGLMYNSFDEQNMIGGGEMRDQATNTDIISQCGTLTMAFGGDAYNSTIDRLDCDSDIATASPGTSVVRDSYLSGDSPTLTSPGLFFDGADPLRTAGDLHPPLSITYWPAELYRSPVWSSRDASTGTSRGREDAGT